MEPILLGREEGDVSACGDTDDINAGLELDAAAARGDLEAIEKLQENQLRQQQPSN